MERRPVRPQAYDFRAHALGGYAPDTVAADAQLAPQVTEALLGEIVALVPDAWLAGEPGFAGPDAVRDAYVAHLAARARHPRAGCPASSTAVTRSLPRPPAGRPPSGPAPALAQTRSGSARTAADALARRAVDTGG